MKVNLLLPASSTGARRNKCGRAWSSPRWQTPGIQGCGPRWLPPLRSMLASSGRPNHSIPTLAI
jgi:hypothetical protein